MKLALAICLAAFFLAFIPFLFWAGGYDFNQRGEAAVMCSLMTVVCAAIAFGMTIIFPNGK